MHRVFFNVCMKFRSYETKLLKLTDTIDEEAAPSFIEHVSAANTALWTTVYMNGPVVKWDSSST